jgi:hypothetical protein
MDEMTLKFREAKDLPKMAGLGFVPRKCDIRVLAFKSPPSWPSHPPSSAHLMQVLGDMEGSLRPDPYNKETDIICHGSIRIPGIPSLAPSDAAGVCLHLPSSLTGWNSMPVNTYVVIPQDQHTRTVMASGPLRKLCGLSTQPNCEIQISPAEP